MTIHLPPRLENPILAAVHSGRYASDFFDAMTEAAAMLVERLEHEQSQAKPPTASQQQPTECTSTSGKSSRMKTAPYRRRSGTPCPPTSPTH